MENPALNEKLLSKEDLFAGRLLHVQRWTVKLPNGREATREIAVHKGAAAVVPVDGDGNVYLVRQYRTALGRQLLEVPAGKLDFAEEDHLAAAKRELREETGFTADCWTHLVDLATTPGFTTEIISLYLARGLRKGETEFDEDEFLDLVKMPFEEAARMALDGEIEDAKTISALLLARRKLAEA